jgi:hypothetical protein
MNLVSAILRTPRLVSPNRLIRPTVLARPYSMEPSLQSPLFTQRVVKAMRAL